MALPDVLSSKQNSLKTDVYLFLFSITATISFLILSNLSGFDKHTLAFLMVVPLFLIFLFNTDLMIIFSVVLLFLLFDVFCYKLVTLSFFPIVVSYLFNTNKKNLINSPNPIFFPFLIYLVTIIPSFTNSIDVFKSIMFTFNIIAFAIMFIVLGKCITDHNQIKKIFITYLVFSFLNGLSVLHESMTEGGRVFGFCGIVYVDFVCIAVIILLTLMLYKKSLFFPLLLLSVFLIATLFLTQTRNTLLSLIATIFIGVIFLFFKSGLFSYKKNFIIKAFVSVIFGAAILYFISKILFPTAFDRIGTLFSKQSISVSSDSDFGHSSLITRLMIWHTAINAFLKHPVIGIGAYSFSFESKYYFTIPSALYKMFVEGLSPHISYLAVLTETGIIGLTGFIIFLVSIVRMSIDSVKLSKNDRTRYYSFGLLLLQIYIITSMFMTDAWLWGQCGMLWGIVTGITIANHRIVKREYVLNND